jgi:DnaA family protein
LEQLTFELSAPEPPSFANFVAGANSEVVAALERAAAGALPETGIVLWGAAGSGKSHLLRAAVAAAQIAGRSGAYASRAEDLPGDPLPSLVAVDAVDAADPSAQARLFTLYNQLREQRGHLLVAASVPPARMTLRDDLRTRLGWGLVYEVRPLADADKAAALAAYARQRGFRLSDEVIGYLLAHGRRDMPSLVATLAALDRHSLALKRPVTVPLLREWLQRDMRL